MAPVGGVPAAPALPVRRHVMYALCLGAVVCVCCRSLTRYACRSVVCLGRAPPHGVTLCHRPPHTAIDLPLTPNVHQHVPHALCFDIVQCVALLGSLHHRVACVLACLVVVTVRLHHHHPHGQNRHPSRGWCGSRKVQPCLSNQMTNPARIWGCIRSANGMPTWAHSDHMASQFALWCGRGPQLGCAKSHRPESQAV